MSTDRAFSARRETVGETQASDGSQPINARVLLPSRPAKAIARPRLSRLLDEAVSQRITIVSAGPGWGKTSAVAEWAAQADQPVAWLTLTSANDYLAGFWGGVLEALTAVLPSSATELRPATVAGGVPDEVEVRLLRTLARLPEPVVLVLDDFHVIEDPGVFDIVLRLVQRDGPLHVVIVTRIDPVFPVHELRLSGHVAEVFARELALTAPELALMSQAEGLQVPAELTDQILERTEGWPAGVRLALMHLIRAGVSAFQSFAGTDRTVAEYLVAEVLQANEPAVRDFLIRTSVCERLNDGLAAAITGEDRAQAMLEGLENRNQFVVSLGPDRRWFRYHPLLREMLEHTLRRDDPGAWRSAHVRAARWYARHGEPLTALEHASAAGEYGEFFAIFTEAAAPGVAAARRPALRRLLATVPYAEYPASVSAQLCAAGLCLTEGDLPGMAAHAARAQSMADATEEPATRALLAVMIGTADRLIADFDGAVEMAGLVLDDISTSDRYPAADSYRVMARNLLGVGLLWNGRLAEATENLARAELEARGAEGLEITWMNAGSHRAMAQAMLGQFADATQAATQLLTEAEDAGLASMFTLRPAYWVLGTIALLHGDERAAEAPIAGGFSAGFGGAEPVPLIALQMAQAAAAVSRRQLPAARQLLDRIATSTSGITLPTYLRDELLRLIAEVTLLSGGSVAAQPPLDSAAGDGTATWHASQARVLLATAQLKAAESAAQLAVEAAATGRSPAQDRIALIEARLVQARIADARHLRYEALAAARDALEAAEPDRLMRPFLVTPGIAALLEAVVDSAASRSEFMVAVVRRLKEPEESPPSLFETLTERELAVLTELPTMKSNGEIADDLFVSVNTIKAHLKGIYRKLGVTSRREAVVRARALGLLR